MRVVARIAGRYFAAALALPTASACGSRSQLLPSDSEPERDAGNAPSDVDDRGAGGSGGCPAHEPQLLAAGEPGAGSNFLALDESHVYWSSAANGTVMRVPKCGGVVDIISTAELTPLSTGVFGPHLFWIAKGVDVWSGVLRRAPKSGGAPSTLASDLLGPTALAVDDDGVFYATLHPDAGTFMMPHAGGTSTKIADAGGYVGLAVDDTHVFWAHGGIARTPKTGGNVEILVSNRPMACCIALDDDWAYWTNIKGSVERVPKTGGTSVEIGPVSTFWRAVAVDATHAYAAADVMEPGVFRFPKSGGEAYRVTAMSSTDVKVDEHHVYWASNESIWRLAKTE